MGAIAPLRLIQLGKETTRGTEVAATARLIPRPDGATWRDATQKAPVEGDFGILDHRHSSSPSVISRNLSELELEADLSFEQILYPLLAGVKGGVTPVAQAGGVDGQLWTFTPNASTDPVPDAFTLEYVEREGGTNRQEITAVYGLCKRLKMSWSAAVEQATLEMEWFARNSVSKAPTASIGLPTRTIAAAQKCKVYKATTFANLESAPTEIVGEVVSAEFELETGIMPKFRLDNVATDFSAYQYGRRRAMLKLQIDLTAVAELERTAGLQASGVRYFRIEAVGPAIGASFYRVRVDGAYEITDPIESGDSNEDQSFLDLEYVSLHDATKGAPFEIKVQNTLATLP